MLCKVCIDALENARKPSRLGSAESHIANTPGLQLNQYDFVPQSAPFTFWYIHGHHRDEQSFAHSAKQGCVICSDFPFDDNVGQRNKVREYGFFTIFWISYENDVPCVTVDSGEGLKTVSLVKTLQSTEDALNYDIPDSTGSPQTWSMVSKWMETCLQNHSSCSKKSEIKDYMPTRLLKINYAHDSYLQHPPTFQLISRNEDFQGSYAAMSYRWGEKPLDKTLRLLKLTSAWLEKPNPIHCLPKTFRDAMHIAHRFGVEYLWIDRLCIYQDSCEDWRREAGTMQDVYRNALFCISALGAENDEGGCFFAREPSLIAPSAVDIYGNGELFRAELEDAAWGATFHDEPLIHRGWVLQERLMAPRTIYFGSKQVFWECAESHACETHPNGFGGFRPACNSSVKEQHEKLDDIDYLPLSRLLIAVPTAPCKTRHLLTRILADWSAVISLYSNTKLTLPRDKLVAVSGLAKDTRKALQHLKPGKHKYLAGLWGDHLIETLCWYVRVGTPAVRPGSYRAPSWSWASLDGYLNIPNTFVEEVVELSTIFSDDIEFIGPDDTGEVASGILVLHGPVCSIDAHALSRNQYAVNAFRLFDTSEGVESIADKNWQHQPTVIFDTPDDFCDEVACIWTTAQPTVLGGWQVSGLALKSSGNGTFLRVGVVSSYYRSQADLVSCMGLFAPREVRIL
ncbi:HET-domain-containing protein [Daldinia bambusicola]|nr:HET-domain-containing protein [Daldinia bambusicola]